MEKDEPVLLKTLKKEGYYVWWGGKNNLIPENCSWVDYCDVKNSYNKDVKKMYGYDTEICRGPKEGGNYYSFYFGKLKKDDADVYYDSDWHDVMSAIELIKNPPKDKPYCIFLPLTYPHPPYAVEEPWYSMFDRENVPERTASPESWDDMPAVMRKVQKAQGTENWKEDRWKELMATYLGMVARIDYQFGLVIDALKASGQYDDTAVFVFADHGDYTRDFGLVEKNPNTFYDCLTRVPFIVKPPSSVSFRPGIRDALIELVDFSATVEELTGVKPKHHHFGKSLLPVITGEKTEHRDAVFCEGGFLINELETIEGLPEINIEGIYGTRIAVYNENGPERTRAVMVRTKYYKYVRRFYEKDQLFDLRKDPKETKNRIDDPELNEVLGGVNYHQL